MAVEQFFAALGDPWMCRHAATVRPFSVTRACHARIPGTMGTIPPRRLTSPPP
jgi:hypothetical protein